MERPNRFIARIMLDGEEKICHVKNTGRCKELLIPGSEIYVQEFPEALTGSPGDLPNTAQNGQKKSYRSTAYDLIAVRKGTRLINMDSLAPNKAAAELLPALFPGLISYSAEQRYGDSRFDLAGEYAQNGKVKKFFLEVKGVTLEQDGVVLFPDAPTERGRKHLEELAKAVSEGYDACILFLIQMENVKYFSPNAATDPAFALALRNANAAGVRLFAYDCFVTPDSISTKERVPIRLADDRSDDICV